MSGRRSFQKFEARIERIGLRNQIHARALELHVSLRELYEGPSRAPSIVAARRDVYRWLNDDMGKGINEIARLFDRAPSGVQRMIRGGGS